MSLTLGAIRCIAGFVDDAAVGVDHCPRDSVPTQTSTGSIDATHAAANYCLCIIESASVDAACVAGSIGCDGGDIAFEAHELPVSSAHMPGAWDMSWLDQLVAAKHRVMFNASAIAGGVAVVYASTFHDHSHEADGTADRDARLVIVSRQHGTDRGRRRNVESLRDRRGSQGDGLATQHSVANDAVIHSV